VTTLSDAQAGINIRQQAKWRRCRLHQHRIAQGVATSSRRGRFRHRGADRRNLYPGRQHAHGDPAQGGWEYSAYQTDNSFIVEVKQSDDAQKKTADGKVKYVGEKLSLNFQNVEVRSVLQVIADFTGLNIIASDTVAGNLTLRLKDVPWIRRSTSSCRPKASTSAERQRDLGRSQG